MPVSLDVSFSTSHRIWSGGMPYERGLIQQVLGIHMHVATMLVLAFAMANLLTDMRSM